MKKPSNFKSSLLYAENIISKEQFKPIVNILSAISKILIYSFGALLALIVLIDPPYTYYSPLIAAQFLASILVLLPKTTKFLTRNKADNGKIFNGGLRLLISIVILASSNVTLQMHDTAKLNLMTPEQLEKHNNEEDEKFQKKYQAEAEQRKQVKNEIERKEIEADAEIENKLQSKFYDDLGAPKILYKCSDSPFYHAYGAKYGSYNTLLADALKKCGEGNVKVIENDK
jgi:hypothetical protein